MRIVSFSALIGVILLVESCGGLVSQDTGSWPLPILGNYSLTEDGDTLQHQVGAFEVIDQDSNAVSLATFDGKIFVADYFFTHCPSICPVMSAQMVRLHDAFYEEEKVGLISFSIDPPRDSVARLQSYVEKLVPESTKGQINSQKWHLVTGDQDHILDLSTSFLVNAVKDEQALGGYLHDGSFILVDENRHIRGYYDGTKADQVDLLIRDINRLLRED